MLLKETHLIPNGAKSQRLSDYLQTAFPLIPSRKAASKALKRGQVQLNGKIASSSHWIQPGEIVEWFDLQQRAPKEFLLKLEVVWEDEFLAVINKPAGFEVSGNKYKTIENALSHNLNPSSEADALPWPRPVHRIDYSTSGLLLIAKTSAAHVSLGRQFEDRTIHKQYTAIVMGTPPPNGEISTPINEIEAHSTFTTLQTVPSLKNTQISLMRLSPVTGRTHQLRIHMASIGCSIMGDQKYGPEGHTLKGKGLFLAATQLQFSHPKTGKEINLKIDMPHKFSALLEREQKRWGQFNP